MALSSSQKKFIAIVGGVVIVFVLAFLLFGRGGGGEKRTINLTIWGVGDTQSDIQPIITEFVKYAKSTDAYAGAALLIDYRTWREDEYEDILLNQMAEGRGPDIFYIHNTWLPKYHNKLVALPADQMTRDQFRSLFLPVAAEDLIYDNKIYALPHYVDTLALYYNTQQFQSSGTGSTRPTATWSAFKAQAAALTNKFGTSITRSGTALGTTKNIKHGVDIFYLMTLQRNGKICRDEKCAAVFLADNKEALQSMNEYTSYSDSKSTNYTWDSNYLKGMETSNIFNDIDAFIRGRVSSIFAYADDYDQISVLGKNSGLRFEISEIPQTDESAANAENIAFASYWAPAVSRNSNYPQLAWDFVKYMTSKDVLTEYYKRRPRPPSREDLMNTDQENPLRVFHRQAKYAQSLVIFDKTRFTQAFSDALETVADKAMSSFNALRKLETDLNKIIDPYLQVEGEEVTESGVQ
ncbi:MAG: hypothetical protein A2V81_02980 [Candidatus Abawacabacteria bacterium RBG_16_42_10]|uniref:ABC transporter substrate-binding protein n=1 Tax=Candidatus Abawacabacteria bacterium RBG_16_42_10 TaxID=1817814 RepID=A0A1F4XKC2_9BACT|nr:MAG: hypothetical protein A2V81_02980 [Candidatus Abawacabacteria bacterium RBG_16_42_10]